MQRISIYFATAIGAVMLFSCGRADYSGENAEYVGTPPVEAGSGSEGYKSAPDDAASFSAATDTVMSASGTRNADQLRPIVSSSAAVMHKDSTMQFIRTADLRFKVKEVRSTTYAIEGIVNHFDGYVGHTRLESNINYTRTTPITADSSLEETFYTVHNDMTLRVPQANLDTTLKSIARLIDYLDFRVIDAENVTFDIIANQLRKRRGQTKEGRLRTAIDQKGVKVPDIANAEDRRDDAQAQADAAYIEELRTADKIAYSTVHLYIYQREAVQREMIANPQNIDAYKPGFWTRVGEGLETGWEGLLAIFIALAYMWPVTLLVVGAIVAAILYRRRSRKRRVQ